MPYSSIADLPENIRKNPEEAQKVFLATFNSAWEGTCKNKQDAEKESCCFAIATSAMIMGKGAGEDREISTGGNLSSFALRYFLLKSFISRWYRIQGNMVFPASEEYQMFGIQVESRIR